MVKILITGGAGFVPSCTAEKLLQDPNNFVVLVDNFLTGRKENVPNHPNCKFIKADVNVMAQLEPIMCSYQFDYVYHYAAMVGVLRTLDNPVAVLEDIQGIKNVLDLAKSTGVKRVFFSSSSEVYGEPVHLPQNEHTTPLNSRLPYAVVKNVGEAYFRSYQQEFDLDYTIFRFFNTYGPKQSEDFVLSKFMSAAVRGEDITIYGDGSQTRTFCYIDDNTDFCVGALSNPDTVNRVYNVGNDLIYTIKDLAELIIKKTGSTSKIVYLPPLKDGDMTRRQPDISKMKNILNRDLIQLEQGIENIIASGRFSAN
ncbi:MAG: NAD-dependent epimerase/dehydratase family protein [Crocinitomicaceae bacterium]|nr:NAD-dependent epimerase/dehydratase family protein [Crocinitomicaceae bacterium]